MAKTLNQDTLGDILNSGGGKYFFHKEEDGEVVITFTSEIQITEPGDEDLIGRIWDPPIVDADGNPLLDFNGNPREKWSKVEAEGKINGANVVYAFGGERSSSLRALIEQMNANEITNDTLPGTKWSIARLGKWNWSIKYLGKEDISSSVSSKKKERNIDNENFETIKTALGELVERNAKVKEGVNKNQLVQTLVFMTGVKPNIIEDMWEHLELTGLIKIDGNVIKIV